MWTAVLREAPPVGAMLVVLAIVTAVALAGSIRKRG